MLKFALPWVLLPAVCCAAAHRADQNQDDAIALAELLRGIQLFNAAEMHCAPDSEDGYAPGAGVRDCSPHDSDYAPQDWRISLSELLRLIQFYNMGAYHECVGSEDGFCPGPQPDTEAPVIVLNGGGSLAIDCGMEYTEPGYTAADDVDGDLTMAVLVDASAVVAPLAPGAHRVIYAVSDAAGNTAIRERVVVSMCDAPVVFADAQLELAVREAIAKPMGDLVPSDLIGNGFTRLDASLRGISALDGLEFCLDLNELDLHGNCIAGLAPLAGLSGLVRLNLHDNHIADVAPLEHLASLDYLWLSRNAIDDLRPLARNAGLDSDPPSGRWDRVNLFFNPLGNPGAEAAVAAMEARGAFITRRAFNETFSGKQSRPQPLTGRVELAYERGRVRMEDFRVYAGVAPPIRNITPRDGVLRIRDALGGEVLVPVLFGLQVTSCGVDEPGGESVGDEEEATEAAASAVFPISAEIRFVAYRAPGEAEEDVLYNGDAVKGMEPCGPADEAGDPIPISAALVWGDPALPDERAFVIVFMGDAFPSDRLGDPHASIVQNNTHYIPWSQAVGDTLHFVLAQEPFAEYASFLKIYRLDLISRDDRPTDLRNEPPTVRDTALRMERKAVGFNYDQALAARIASNAGIAWDRIVLVPNGDGSGTQTANFIVYSNFSPSRKMTALHELGHGVGLLSDEYEYRHGTNPPASLAPGIVIAPNAISMNDTIPGVLQIPWEHWLPEGSRGDCVPSALGMLVDFLCHTDENTQCQCGAAPMLEEACVPLPTCEPDGDFVAQDGKLYGRIAWPEPAAAPSRVGLYEGAKYRRKGAYRPELRCRMRSDDDVEPGLQETPRFCTVCREHLVMEIVRAAGNARTVEPAPESPVLFGPGSLIQFSIEPHAPASEDHALEISDWTVDGTPVMGSAGLQFAIEAATLTQGPHTVSVTLRDATPWVHPAHAAGQEAVTQTLTWSLLPE